MRKILILSFMTFIMTLLTGCGKEAHPPIYQWGEYVDSSANYGMKGHEKEILEKHIRELEKIINTSDEKNQRVAPGIYAEYAQILYETNKKVKAKKYFLLEKQTYEESSVFIDRVLAKLYGEAQ